MDTRAKLTVAFEDFSFADVNPEDKRFFKELGARIAQLRKEQNLTQQQLADELGVSQPIVASYDTQQRFLLQMIETALAQAGR